ncbi:MAG: hypothetical protein ACPGES_12460, partial [Coraliomargarita sp.]
SSYGRGSGGFGNGTGSGGAGIREMAITATLFGTEVTATKLGVLLDISFSTHKQIDKVLKEINKEFKDAVVVLAPGCVISTHKVSIYPLEDYEKGTKKHTDVGKFSTQTFTERLLEENKEFEKIWGKLEQDKRGFILFAEHANTGKTGNGGSNDALEFLRDEGVDTIYWFADFQDSVNDGPAKEVLKSMKRGNITLIMHDFVSPLGPSKKNPGRLALLQALADETDGKFFLKVLK